jgi:hypothetical protein
MSFGSGSVVFLGSPRTDRFSAAVLLVLACGTPK